jgi:predicted transcriptional regulator
MAIREDSCIFALPMKREVRRRLQMIAAEQDRSVASIIRIAIDEWLANRRVDREKSRVVK